MEDIRILVTGGDEFLGINLIRYLLRQGYSRIASLDIAELDYPEKDRVMETAVSTTIKDCCRLLRIKHWVKDVFVFAPLVFSLNFYKMNYLWKALAMFVAFSLASSVVYVINDIVDRDRDRDDTRTFTLCLLISAITTAVFWAFELGFHFLFSFRSAKYLGPVIGLSIGYSLKYLPDKQFVFQKRKESLLLHRLREIAELLRRKARHLFLIIPMLFYFLTASRTPGWLDATLIVSNVVNMHLSSWVNNHPLFNLLGYFWLKLFPADNIHFYLVLLSALFGALTVYLVFLTGLELGANPVSAGIGALAVMVSHSLWWHSTMLEVYTLNTVLMISMLYCVLRYHKTERTRYLYLAAWLFGLGCSNHVLMGLFIFAFIGLIIFLICRRMLSLKKSLVLGLCFLLGFQLYLFVFVRDFSRNLRQRRNPSQSVLLSGIEALKHTVHRATGGDFKRHMFTKGLSSEKRRFWRINYFVLLLYNFPSPAFILGFYGLYLFYRDRSSRGSFLFFLPGILAQALWSANYFIWDMYAFSLPVYVLFSIPVILAVDHLLQHSPAVRKAVLCIAPTFLLSVLLYAKLPDWYDTVPAIRRYFDHHTELVWARHTWDPVQYFADPNKRNYDEVECYVNQLFSLLPRGAHFLNSDSRSDYPLRFYYRDIYRLRTDINYHSLFSPFLSEEEARRVAIKLKGHLDDGEPVYTASVNYPERMVLNELYHLFDSSTKRTEVARMSTEQLVESFPGLDLEKVILFEEDQIWIYAIRPATDGVIAAVADSVKR